MHQEQKIVDCDVYFSYCINELFNPIIYKNIVIGVTHFWLINTQKDVTFS